VFDIDKTYEQLTYRTKREWNTFFLKQKNIQIPLDVELDKGFTEVNKLLDSDYIHVEKTLQNVKDRAENLNDDDVTLVYEKDKEIKLDLIAETTIDIPEDLSASVLNY